MQQVQPTAGEPPPEELDDETADGDAPDAEPLPPYTWSLERGSCRRTALDELSVSDIETRQLLTCRSIPIRFTAAFAKALAYTLRGLRTATAAAATAENAAYTSAEATAAAWAKLWQLIPSILLVPDGRESRKQRFGVFATGLWHVTLQHTLAFVDQRAVAPRTPQTKAAQRAAHPRVARQLGGMERVARAAATGPNTSSPRTAATLAALQLKHPVGDPIDQLQGVEDAGRVTSQGHLAAAVAAVAAAAAAAAEAVEPQQEEPLVAATAANSISAIFTVPKL
jgi:hypothetical protein